MTKLSEILKNATLEQLQKAAACKNADELLVLAKAEKIEITAEQAEELFKKITLSQGELPDEEMDSVAGGGGKFVIFTCPNCNTQGMSLNIPDGIRYCNKCGYSGHAPIDY